MFSGVLSTEVADCIGGRIEGIIALGQFLNRAVLLGVLSIDSQRSLTNLGNIKSFDGFGRRNENVIVPAAQIEKVLVKSPLFTSCANNAIDIKTFSCPLRLDKSKP